VRALVTGAAGFVGRHMIAELLDRGYSVEGIDNRWPRATVVAGRLVEIGEDVRDWFADNYPPTDVPGYDTGDRWHYDLVVHCAAVVGGRAMIEGKPLELACEDLSIDAAMFQWAMKAQPGRIVYYSSSAAYPIAWQDERLVSKHLPPGSPYLPMLAEGDIDVMSDRYDLDEGVSRWPWMPDQTYGWVKLTGERLAREYQAAGGKVTVLRPFSGYGEDQDLSYPFPAIMERVRRGADPIDVWGPGTQVRDWIHIDDVIAGTLAAVEAEVDEPLNLCTGVATSFGSLVAQAVAVALAEPNTANRVSVRWLDGPPEIRTNPDQPTGVLYRVGDPTRMLKVFEPKVTLEEGIRRALA
jgi:nucleoside-diphosphate-sugar epimerase